MTVERGPKMNDVSLSLTDFYTRLIVLSRIQEMPTYWRKENLLNIFHGTIGFEV